MITPFRPKKNVPPYHPAGLDIETDENGRETFVGMRWEREDGTFSTVNAESWHDFHTHYRREYKSADKETRRRMRKIYAHNGGGFDWLHYSRYCMDNGIVSKLRSYQTGSKMVGIDTGHRISGDRFTLRLRDSLALMPGSLDKLAKTFKVDTQKVDLGGRLPEEVRKTDIELFYKYAESDVRAGQEIVKRFWDLIYKYAGNIGELPMTLPSLAMRLWRMTLDTHIMTPKNRHLKSIEREAYTGGRTECLKPGKYKKVRVYDINSQYPTVMMNGVFPVDYRGAWVDEYQGNHGIYRLRFNQTNRVSLPVLHVKTDDGLRFVYEGEGTYTQPEIERLLHVGGNIEVYEGYEYYRMGNPFRKFIDKWYTIRKQAIARDDEGLAYVCKILMNSLYGKFGQAEEGWSVEVWDQEKKAQKLEDDAEFRDFGDCVQVKHKREQEFVFVGIAAYVTAQARMLIYGYAENAQANGNDVIYMDTDSLHVTGKSTLPIGPELGQLKLEYEGRAVYVGKKLYTLLDGEKAKIKVKGVGRQIKRYVVGTREKRGKFTLADVLTERVFTDMVYKGTSILLEFEAFPSSLEVFTGAERPAVVVDRTRTLRCLSPPKDTR